MTSKFFPLSDVGLELRFIAWGGNEEIDLNWFAGVFLKTWSAIPNGDRGVIADYWGSGQTLQDPVVELQGVWSGDKNAIASTKMLGAEVVFSWKVCKILLDGVLPNLIAHEMGHVFHYALGKHRLNMTVEDLPHDPKLLPLPLCENGLVELFADQTMERWGFDPLSPETHLRQFYDVKDGAYVKRRKPRSEKRVHAETKRILLLSRYDSGASREKPALS